MAELTFKKDATTGNLAAIGDKGKYRLIVDADTKLWKIMCGTSALGKGIRGVAKAKEIAQTNEGETAVKAEVPTKTSTAVKTNVGANKAQQEINDKMAKVRAARTKIQAEDNTKSSTSKNGKTANVPAKTTTTKTEKTGRDNTRFNGGEVIHGFGDKVSELAYAISSLGNARGSRDHAVIHCKNHPFSTSAVGLYLAAVVRCFTKEATVYSLSSRGTIGLPAKFRFEYFATTDLVEAGLCVDAPEGNSVLEGHTFDFDGGKVTLPVDVNAVKPTKKKIATATSTSVPVAVATKPVSAAKVPTTTGKKIVVRKKAA